MSEPRDIRPEALAQFLQDVSYAHHTSRELSKVLQRQPVTAPQLALACAMFYKAMKLTLAVNFGLAPEEADEMFALADDVAGALVEKDNSATIFDSPDDETGRHVDTAEIEQLKAAIRKEVRE